VTVYEISVSGACSTGLTLAADLALWARHGVTVVSIPAHKLGPGDAHRVADAGLDVTSVLILGPSLDRRDGWTAFHDQLLAVFDAAAVLQAHYVALTSGSAGQMPWTEATAALGALLEPVIARAPCPLILEHTNQLRSDISFVHRLRDAVDVGRDLGLGVLMETTACWQERGVEQTIAGSASLIGLVHVSDLGPTVRSTPDRLVPGDGVLPLERLVRTLLASGFAGRFELEYAGPQIEAMGYDAALERAIPALQDLLRRAGGARAGKRRTLHSGPDGRTA
jgi:sugar phosphate isomerase/epimerase